MEYKLKKESNNEQQSVASSIAKKTPANTAFQLVDKRPNSLKPLPSFQQKVTQLGKTKKKKSTEPSKPKMYQIVKEGWSDVKAMKNHCWTYCDKTQTTLVQAAKKLGLQPPMLGHGSNSSKGGTAKDAKLYADFKAYMEYELRNKNGRSLDVRAKNILKGK